MSVVQIGGQDFVLQTPRSGQLINLDDVAIRSNFYSHVYGPLALIPSTLINLDNIEFRSKNYKYTTVVQMGPFRPEPKPTSGYTYPRRTRL